jgi:ParB-like chromosome segregation protein Spo0J
MADTWAIDSIRIGERHRRDLGDIPGLARSINEIGLLHPVVVRPDGTLIAGERRIAACRMLGWQSVPVTAIDLESVVRGEFAENAVRKDFTPSEAVAIAAALEPVERAAARERQGQRTDLLPEKVTGSAGVALDRVAAAVGMSRPTLAKAREVVEAAEREPERFGGVLGMMDSTGNVSRAYKELKRAVKAEAKTIPAEAALSELCALLCGDVLTAGAGIADESVDIIITDPPYPQEYLPVYAKLGELASRVLKPGGSVLAMVGQSYLPDVMAALGASLTYHWMVAYLTPGGQSAQLWQRKVNTFWKPVLWYVKGAYAGDWIGDVARSEPNDNDKRFHGWGQSETGMADLLERFTYPGETVLDPFCGGGTTGVVAVKMGRRFIGIDKDPTAIETTRSRINA